MSEEEKEAIKLLNSYLTSGNKEGILYSNLRIIYFIIYKLQKENKELKEILYNDYKD